MDEENQVSRQKWILTELLLLILILTALDTWYDLKSGASDAHMLFMALAFVISVLCIFFIWHRRIAPMAGDLRASIRDRRELEKELNHWKTTTASYASYMRLEIEKQFIAWKLSPAEKETAYLLLKGLSLREIATVRNVTEKTVKQQNVAIYQKSSLAGRAELSAFFLEDLLALDYPGPTSPQTPSRPA